MLVMFCDGGFVVIGTNPATRPTHNTLDVVLSVLVAVRGRVHGGITTGGNLHRDRYHPCACVYYRLHTLYDRTDTAHGRCCMYLGTKEADDQHGWHNGQRHAAYLVLLTIIRWFCICWNQPPVWYLIPVLHRNTQNERHGDNAVLLPYSISL